MFESRVMKYGLKNSVRSIDMYLKRSDTSILEDAWYYREYDFGKFIAVSESLLKDESSINIDSETCDFIVEFMEMAEAIRFVFGIITYYGLTYKDKGRKHKTLGESDVGIAASINKSIRAFNKKYYKIRQSGKISYEPDTEEWNKAVLKEALNLVSCIQHSIKGIGCHSMLYPGRDENTYYLTVIPLFDSARTKLLEGDFEEISSQEWKAVLIVFNQTKEMIGFFVEKGKENKSLEKEATQISLNNKIDNGVSALKKCFAKNIDFFTLTKEFPEWL